MKDVLCLGLIVVDLLIGSVPNVDLLKYDTISVNSIRVCGGGDAFNQAVALQKMGKTVALWGRVGSDTFGLEAKRLLDAHHVDSRYLVVDDQVETSVSAIVIGADASRVILHKSGENNAFTLENLDLSVLDNVGVLCIGSLRGLPGVDGEPLAELLRYAKSKGIITVADTTARLHERCDEDVHTVLPWIDYFLPSEGEARDLTEKTDIQEIADTLQSWGASTVVIKRGSKGCYVASKDEHFVVPTLQVNAIDTTGAGDNFVGGFASKLCEGADLRHCVASAVTAGALSTTCVGAGTAPYTYEDVERGIQKIINLLSKGENDVI